MMIIRRAALLNMGKYITLKTASLYMYSAWPVRLYDLDCMLKSYPRK